MGKIAIKTNATADISSILPEVLRFYDATATSTITLASGTNNITSWGDRSVNNVPATQSIAGEQPIYNSSTKTISMSPIRNFLINFGANAFSGTVYIADAVHGVLDFAISVNANTILNTWANSQNNSTIVFSNIIGIVITSNRNHKNVIENYFGGKSQNLKFSNFTNLAFGFFVFGGSFNLANNVTSFPIINTTNVTNFSYCWRSNGYNQTFYCFPLLNTANGTNFESSWAYNGIISTTAFSFPPINTANGTNFKECWQYSKVGFFPAINLINAINLESTWRVMPLTPLSLDNILISIAAGFANNIGKTITSVVSIFTSITAILSHENRRPITNNPEDTQDTISNWNTIIDNYLSGGLTLDQMGTQHANAIDTYNTKWKSWEQALRNTNESLNGVQYNFSNGTVSGQKAYYWILAKKSLTIPLAAPTTLTTEVTRSYRSNSGLTVSNSNVSGWTPVTVASNQGNQTIFNLTTQTINGITCVMFSNTKTITFNSTNVGTGHRVYIGTLYGYVKITPPTATNLKISTDTITELPIISIMVTTTAVNETEVLLRLGYYGSFQEFNYTANGLTSNNIQLTAV